MEFVPRRVLITGGTGSFGRKLLSTMLREYPDLERLVVFSRDELKQYELGLQYPTEKYKCLRYFLGDVRDRRRLVRAFKGIDTVIHAAALKQVPAAEYNPMEFVKTNVLGAENVVEAAIDMGVEKVVALSTDKACAPVNLYGASKLCSDKIFVAANNYSGHAVKFSVVRYGNVMGSRGSVIPYFLDKRNEGVLPVTHPDMTRFNISLAEGVDMVLMALKKGVGGEIFVPRIPSYRILDLAQAIGPKCEIKEVGLRPGEKIHEEMITDADAPMTVTLNNRFAILPSAETHIMDQYLGNLGGQLVAPDFRYNSGTNEHFLTIDEIRDLIVKHVDPDFVP